RVPRVRRQGVVARVQEGQVDVEGCLLGADRGDDLTRRIEGHVEAALVEVAYSGPELRPAAVARITVRLGLAHGLLHGPHDQRRRGPVGISDAEADHVDPGRALGGDLALELRERIRRYALQAFAWLHAAAPPPAGARRRVARGGLMRLAPAPWRTPRSAHPQTPAAPTPTGSRAAAGPPRPRALRHRARPRCARFRRRPRAAARARRARTPPRRRSPRCPTRGSPPPRARRCARECAPAARARARRTRRHWCGWESPGAA